MNRCFLFILIKIKIRRINKEILKVLLDIENKTVLFHVKLTKNILSIYAEKYKKNRQ